MLDVGCGYGASARWLSSRLLCHVIGITISYKQARLSRRYNERRGLDELTAVVHGDAAALPFSAESFDVVWVIECIEHLVEKSRFVLDAARLLRPGGRLALCSWQLGRDIDRGELEQVCEAFLCPSLAGAAEYRTWCREAGLRVEHQEELTGCVRPTWEVLQRRLGRPWLAPFRVLLGGATRKFVNGFAAIARAYDNGTMTYGLLVASKP